MPKISEGTELSAIPAATDLIPVVDVSDLTQAASGSTKYIQFSNLNPDASETVAGRLEIATAAEALALTATDKALVPATFDDALGGVDGKLIRVDINGLVGDGATDDTAALQTILTANQATNDIVLRFSPNKTYILGNVTWSGSGTLILEGPGATLKLAATTDTSMFSITNPTNFIVKAGLIFDGNDANNTAVDVLTLLHITTGANTDVVAVDGVKFQNSYNGAINVTNTGTDAAGCRVMSVTNVSLYKVAVGGIYNALRARGNVEHLIYSNIDAFDCGWGAGAKIVTWSSDIDSLSDQIGNVIVSNITTDRCATTIFGQSHDSAVITNVTSTRIGTNSAGTDFVVNFMKFDDVGLSGRTKISNATGTSIVAGANPAVRFEESGGGAEQVTKNIEMTNVYNDGDILAGASGGHKLIRCETSEDFAVSDNCELVGCTGGTTFNISGADNMLLGCTSPLLTFVSTASHCTAQGGVYTGVTYQNGATFCRVVAAKIRQTASGNSCINMSGDNQFLQGCEIDHGGGLAIDIEKVGAVGIYVENNYMQQVSTGATVPLIRMADPLEVYIRGNVATASTGSRMRRTATTQSLYGEISGNVGFEDGFTDLPGGTVGDLVMERNRHWASGTLTELPSYHPTEYTITSDLTDRTFDANTVAIAELADVVATLIKDMERA